MADFRHETARLTLRDWRRGDIEAFAQVTNTPAVMRWLGGVLDGAALAALEARVIERQETLGHTFWMVERKDDGRHLSGEILGFCGLKLIDAPGNGFPGRSRSAGGCARTRGATAMPGKRRRPRSTSGWGDSGRGRSSPSPTSRTPRAGA